MTKQIQQASETQKQIAKLDDNMALQLQEERIKSMMQKEQ